MIFCYGLPFYSRNTNEVSLELVPMTPVPNSPDQSESLLDSFLLVLGTLGLERQDCRTPLFSHTSTTDDQVKDLLVE